MKSTTMGLSQRKKDFSCIFSFIFHFQLLFWKITFWVPLNFNVSLFSSSVNLQSFLIVRLILTLRAFQFFFFFYRSFCTFNITFLSRFSIIISFSFGFDSNSSILHNENYLFSFFSRLYSLPLILASHSFKVYSTFSIFLKNNLILFIILFIVYIT